MVLKTSKFISAIIHQSDKHVGPIRSANLEPILSPIQNMLILHAPR
jgi:hypothetical protein